MYKQWPVPCRPQMIPLERRRALIRYNTANYAHFGGQLSLTQRQSRFGILTDQVIRRLGCAPDDSL